MPGAGCRLFRRFEGFWEFAVAETQAGRFQPRPLLHIADNWNNWRNGLAQSDRLGLERLINTLEIDEQDSFLEKIRSWVKEQNGRFACDTAWLVLHQLSKLKEFEHWETLRRYRRHEFEGIYAVFLHGTDSPGVEGMPTSDSVKPLRVAFVEGESESWQYYPYEVVFDGVGLNHVQRSLKSLLGGSGFATFALYWALCGWRLRPSPTRIAVGLSGGIALLAALLLWIWYPLPRFIVMTSLWAVVGGCCLLVGIGAAVLIREWVSVRQRRKDLKNAIGVIVLGNCKPGVDQEVDQNSYAVSLYLATLQALYRGDSADGSAISWCTQKLRKNRSSIAFTGELSPSGRVQAVDRIAEKVATCANRKIPEFVVPRQEIPPTDRGSAGAPELRIRRFPPFVPLPIGALLSATRAYAAAAVVTLMTVAVAVASIGAQAVLAPAAGPRILVAESGFLRDLEGGQDVLLVAIGGLDASGCEVDLTSRYWANRSTEIPGGSSSPWKAELSLDKLDHPAVMDNYDGELEIVCGLTFLGRALRYIVVERTLLREVATSF